MNDTIHIGLKKAIVVCLIDDDDERRCLVWLGLGRKKK